MWKLKYRLEGLVWTQHGVAIIYKNVGDHNNYFPFFLNFTWSQNIIHYYIVGGVANSMDVWAYSYNKNDVK